MWYDIHCHLDMLEEGVDQAINFAKAQGVQKIITIGTEWEDHAKVLAFSAQNPDFVKCSIGIHPHHGSTWNQDSVGSVRASCLNPQVVAVGEIGLDYYYNQSPRDLQLEAFEAQMGLAADLQLPVEIHTREAEKDTVEVLQKFKGRVKGVIHCFTSSMWLAEKSLDCGWDISFSGIVTFKNADDLRSVAKYVPNDRIHVETDAPFLAPVPQRGKKNTPGFVRHTGEFLAQLRGQSLEAFAELTRQNGERLFGARFC